MTLHMTQAKVPLSLIKYNFKGPINDQRPWKFERNSQINFKGKLAPGEMSLQKL